MAWSSHLHIKENITQTIRIKHCKSAVEWDSTLTSNMYHRFVLDPLQAIKFALELTNDIVSTQQIIQR